MSDSHPWSHDPARDAAARREEDEMKGWRLLEVGEVVQAGDEYQEQVWPKHPGGKRWHSVPGVCVGKPIDSGHLPHRRRVPSAPQHRDLPEAVAALTERVAELTTKHNALADLARLDAGWLKANEQRLTAERDAARARVAELEAAPPPRGWLTAEERKAVDAARDYFDDDNHGDSECVFIARMLKQLLARSSPPRVRRPKRAYPPVPGGVVHLRDTEWIAAIRAAGGEVEE